MFIIKLISGLALNSVAVIGDAFNNLSDMGSSVVSIISAKLSGKAPDKDHPFGHGRIEYIASLIISFLIMMVGVELLKSSVNKIFNPEEIVFDLTAIIILALSVLVKFWMFSYNRYIGKKVNSEAALATATDCINDAVSTLAVIIATILSLVFSISLDGYIGLAVCILIFKGGISAALETVNLLLGKPPKKETVDRIEEIIISREGICGIHDLMVHDYGPGRVFASVHAEVPDDVPSMLSHEIIDALECEIEKELGITMVIHMDPIAVGSEQTDLAKATLLDILAEYGPEYSVHDFRITEGDRRINIIFDLVVPSSLSPSARVELSEKISAEMHHRDERYVCVVKVENNYI